MQSTRIAVVTMEWLNDWLHYCGTSVVFGGFSIAIGAVSASITLCTIVFTNLP